MAPPEVSASVEAALALQGASPLEAAAAAARWGLCLGDPRRRLPQEAVAWSARLASVQGTRDHPIPRVDPTGRRVAFAGGPEVSIFEAPGWGRTARFETGAQRVDIRWIDRDRLACARLRSWGMVDLEVWDLTASLEARGGSEGVGHRVAPSPSVLEPRRFANCLPAASLPEGWWLLASTVNAGGVSLIAPDGTELGYDTGPLPAGLDVSASTFFAVAGPTPPGDPAARPICVVRTLCRGGSQLLVLRPEADLQRPGPVGPKAVEPSWSSPRRVEPLAWTQDGFAHVEVDHRSAEVVGAPAPGAEARWRVELDLPGEERVTGITEDGQVVLSRPGRVRLIHARTGRPGRRGPLPEGCRAWPLGAGALLAVRPGRFEVVAGPGRRAAPATSVPPAAQPRPLPPTEPWGPILGLTLCPDGSLLVVGETGRVRVLDPEGGVPRVELEGPDLTWRARSSGGRLAVQVSAEGHRWLVPGPRGFRVLEEDGQAQVHELVTEARGASGLDRIWSVALAPDGGEFALGDRDGVVRRIQVGGAALPPLPVARGLGGLEQVLYHPDGRHLAVFLRRRLTAWEIDRGTGRLVHSWSPPSDIDRALARRPTRGPAPRLVATDDGYSLCFADGARVPLRRGEPVLEGGRVEDLRAQLSPEHGEEATADLGLWSPTVLAVREDLVVSLHQTPEIAAWLQVVGGEGPVERARYEGSWASADDGRVALDPQRGVLYVAAGEVVEAISIRPATLA